MAGIAKTIRVIVYDCGIEKRFYAMPRFDNSYSYLAAPCIALSAFIASCSSISGVPPNLMQGAECMADVLRSNTRAIDVRVAIAHEQHSTYPILSYGFVDRSGHTRTVHVRVYEISGLYDELYTFDIPDIDGDPVALDVLAPWEVQCHAGRSSISNE